MVKNTKELKVGDRFTLVSGDIVYVCLGSILGDHPGAVDPESNGIWAQSTSSGAVSFIPYQFRPQVNVLESEEV